MALQGSWQGQLLTFDLTFESRNSTYAILESLGGLVGPSLLDSAKPCDYNASSGTTTTPLILS
jgi:hypothetical protein